MEIELSAEHKRYLWKKYLVLYEICICVKEFREIFSSRRMPSLYLFLKRHQQSSVKEIASFAKGLPKDKDTVENAVASNKSNGLAEGTNSRLKMVKRTMHGRCSRYLLEAKLLYQK